MLVEEGRRGSGGLGWDKLQQLEETGSPYGLDLPPWKCTHAN
jgi:hypothetical protein